MTHGPSGIVRLALTSPRLVLLDEFVDAQEPEQLIAWATPQLAPTAHLALDGSGAVTSARRTSEGTRATRRGETACAERIDRRIEALTGIPASHGEPLQVLRYVEGAEYEPHHDFFSEAELALDARFAEGGQRIATLLLYLNDGFSGGETSFPELQLDVHPRRGAALYFAYSDGTSVDRRLRHAGREVRAGQKWIAVKWLRERPFQLRS